MKDLERFGNLLNEQDNPIVIREFEQSAISQGRRYYRDGFQVYLLDDILAVAKMSNGKITRYTLLGNRDEYKQVYTGSRDSVDIMEQALYHGACILTRRAGQTIGLNYNI